MNTYIADLQIAFSNRVLRLLNSYRQHGPKANEAGGILLGQFNGEVVLVTRASLPTPGDRCGRHSFVRNAQTAQVVVNYEFRNSEGLTNYVGEWHTHPEPQATPSSHDRRMIKSAFIRNDLVANFLLLTILGTEEDYLGFYNGSNLQGKTVHLCSACEK